MNNYNQRILPRTAGEVVPIEMIQGVAFAERMGGTGSVYRDALAKLTDDNAVAFPISKYHSIRKAAKHMGVNVLYAMYDGKVYVRKSNRKPERKAEQTPKPTWRQAKTPDPLTLMDAVRSMVREAPRTTAEVADHVLLLKPDTTRSSISAILSQLRDKNEIAKRDDLKWYPTGAGKR